MKSRRRSATHDLGLAAIIPEPIVLVLPVKDAPNLCINRYTPILTLHFTGTDEEDCA